MDRRFIEEQARAIQAKIWHDRDQLFPMGVPSPKHMLEPQVAAEVLGFRYETIDRLGNWGQGKERFEIAGMLDRQRRFVAVSTRFDYPVQRFTGAHEIGHVVLHRHQVMHRDRPIFNIDKAAKKHPVEQEADYFAACFLAPEQLVVAAYKARFGIGPPLPLNDDIAFHLAGTSAHALMRAGSASLEFASAVASARRFNGKPFYSLAEEFGISNSAMAIRLRELNLVDG
jgi:Zn-dependent peptidase ImmA (M78 family)